MIEKSGCARRDAKREQDRRKAGYPATQARLYH
jgi:hypothetical protein